MNDPGSTNIPRAAPPTTPGTMAPDLPHWPTTIGVVAIVFGAFGVLSIVGGGAVTVLSRTATGASLTPIGWATMVLGLCAGLWHLVSGILTVRRSRRGPSSLLAWAVANSVLVVVSAALGFADLTTSYAPGMKPPSHMMDVSYAMMIPGIFLSFAWPVFLLVYLTRPARKAHWKSWR